MALWIDLIPRLHKSDDLDPRFHQLENSSDRNSFEEEGTRDVVFQPETADPTPTTGTSPSTATAWSIAATKRSPSPSAVRTRRTTTPHRVATVSPPVESQTDAWVDAGVDPDHSNASLWSLRVTVGIGCALLFLNLLIFAGLCYQKDRVRREMRMNTRFLDHLLRGKEAQDMAEQHRQLHHHQHHRRDDIYSVGPIVSTDVVNADANFASDSNGGNSIPRSISLHHHHQQQQHSSRHQTTLQTEADSTPEIVRTTSSVQKDLDPSENPYSRVLPRCCLVPPTTTTCPTAAAAAAGNHVDCCDVGLPLKYLPSSEHGAPLLLNDEHLHCGSNPSTVV